ncbi:head-tail connector protein [Mycobacterium phage EagleEye]|uniref:Head-to-tail connector protein n=1 Tax=Mycobacterium phage EagleEye TaxID=1429759 RepID=W0LJ41_9CAUD|nr:head-tail connector protein [Mycobacterium phage EagleEye]AHG23801.1 hypothetical protein PBI_EAGLEEYE_21 [Mycobacterium phage EagleEye]QDK03456.1 hypothetical protein SEA_LUCYEDI_20 [Mycobacterium phage Lucyedi]QNJ55814.1 hypothetical protein SEA_PAINTERBOY_20 [Mycobacterium phage PainterBoy]
MSGSSVFRAPINYPPNFIVAVLPGQVNPNLCDHEADPPVCNCVHDWRIDWKNQERKA